MLLMILLMGTMMVLDIETMKLDAELHIAASKSNFSLKN